MNLYLGGIDTSRVTLYFVIRYMAGLPDIQNKVQEEIDNVVGEQLYYYKNVVNFNLSNTFSFCSSFRRRLTILKPIIIIAYSQFNFVPVATI